MPACPDRVVEVFCKSWRGSSSSDTFWNCAIPNGSTSTSHEHRTGVEAETTIPLFQYYSPKPIHHMILGLPIVELAFIHEPTYGTAINQRTTSISTSVHYICCDTHVNITLTGKEYNRSVRNWHISAGCSIRLSTSAVLRSTTWTAFDPAKGAETKSLATQRSKVKLVGAQLLCYPVFDANCIMLPFICRLMLCPPRVASRAYQCQRIAYQGKTDHDMQFSWTPRYRVT